MTDPTTTTPPTGDAPPRKPRVPRKGVDAALRIAETSANPDRLAKFVAGNRDMRTAILADAALDVAKAESVLDEAKARHSELGALAFAIEGLGGFALSGVSAALAGRITK